MKQKQHARPRASLILADGRRFDGESIGADGVAVGEVVFNTAMTGYQEILTDPSYARQLVTLTYPHVGNTGVNSEDLESRQTYAAGLIVRDVPRVFSNFRSAESLESCLKTNGVVGIAGIDTRALTRHIREHGSQPACVVTSPGNVETDRLIDEHLRLFDGLAGLDLAKEVTTTSVYKWTEDVWQLDPLKRQSAKSESRHHVVAYDFGVKHNILRLLVHHGANVTVVPAQTSADRVFELEPDGVFLSNGPGDPEPCTYAIEAIEKILNRNIPVFGICLGHQLLALASGGRTTKMKFGHHGANHPVKDLDNGRVYITSQNHGFTVDEALGHQLEVTHRSLFDGSIQGLRRTDRPAFSFQGHPEGSPGPHDVQYLFKRFSTLMDEVAAAPTIRTGSTVEV